MARYALVVGISQYEEPFEMLSKAVVDANAVADLLKKDKKYQNVEVLAGEVTGAKLVKALKTFLQERAAKNEALIYFTGHGFTVIDIAGETEGYLATSNCSVTIEDSQTTTQKGGLPLSSFNKLIQASDLSNLIVLLDTCHSGAFLEQELIKQSFQSLGSRTDYYLITGCRSFEEGNAKKREKHSVFTGALLGGLSQENADEQGKVTGDRLFDFIYTELHGSKQEPIRMGIGRSISIVEYSSKTKTVTAILDEKGEVVCPYQGLQAFDRDQKEFFFGRKRLVEIIKQNLSGSPFVPVIGASGSGKSSVVRAGLIPWLEEEGNWQILEPIKPGFEPLVELRGTFKSFFKGKDEKQLKAFIEEKDKNSKGLANIVERLPGSNQFLLVIDQFEEVFTVCADEGERQRFIELITQVTEISNCRLSVVTTMRAYFLEPCLRYPSLYQQIQKQAVFMPPLAGVDLRDVITEPARRQGYALEEELVFKILEDVGKEPGFLPLLEFALTKLWHKRDQEKHLLTLDEYNKLGGLSGALDLHAEQVYLYRDFESDFPGDKREEKEQDWIRKIFLRLVRTGEQEKDTRQRQAKSTLLVIAGDEQEAFNELLEGEVGLVKGRLLVTGQDRREAKPWIDLAHEALIEGWQRLTKWRRENRDLRRMHDRLEDTLREWQKNPRDENLMMGGLLAQVREHWQELEQDLSPIAKEFYKQSHAHDQEKVVALQKALLREQSERVIDLLSVQPVDGLAMAIQTVGRSLSDLGEVFTPTQLSLNKAVKVAREYNRFEHQSLVNAAIFIPNSERLISGGGDGNLLIWDFQGNSIGEPFQGHQSAVRAIAINFDGSYIASCGNDKTIRLWDSEGNSVGEAFVGHDDDVISIAFSPLGQFIISGSKDKTLRLWDFQGREIGQFVGHEHAIRAVAFSPDGQYIVSGSQDRTIRLWNIEGKQIGEPFQGHEGAITCVSFSIDSQQIVSSSEDRTIQIWNIEGEKISSPLRGHQSSINSVFFNENSQYILSVSEDKTVRLWDVQDLLKKSHFHESEQYQVRSVDFSPNGQYIVSGGRGVQLWDLNGNLLRSLQKDEYGGYIFCVAFSPDGKYIVGGGVRQNDSYHLKSDRIYLWKSDGELVNSSFLGHEAYVSSVAFSPDSQYIVSGSDDGTICLWNLQGRQVNDPFQAHERTFRAWGHNLKAPSVSSVCFSPDGQYIISGGDDRRVCLWNLQGERIWRYPIGGSAPVSCLSFSPDGQYIAIGGYGSTIRLWDSQGNPINEQIGSSWFVTKSVTFSPDGQYIAGSNSSGTYIWDLYGNPIGEPFQGGDSIAFSPNGQHIVGAKEAGIWLQKFENWENWLQRACERLRHHPIFRSNSTKEESCAVCQKYTWSEAAAARNLINQGKLLAYKQDIKGAVNKFQEALKLNPNLSLIPEIEAQRPKASVLVMQGRLLALEADVEKALLKFQEALSVVPDLALDPKIEIKRLAVPVLIEQGKSLAQNEADVAGAIAKFQQALGLDATLELNPEVEAKQLVAMTLVSQGRNLVSGSSEVDVAGAISKFQQALDLDSSLDINPESEAHQLAAATLIEEGRNLVSGSSEVDVAGAISKFQQALDLDSSLEIDPESEARRLAAATLIEEGKKLLSYYWDEDVDIDGAITRFRQTINEAITKLQQARKLLPSLRINPESEVWYLAAPRLIEKGRQLAQKGRIEESLVLYAEAQEFDSTLEAPAEAWNSLCWFGSLFGYASNLGVIAACERAVEIEPDNYSWRDSRGVNRVLRSDPDIPGAIEDFQVFISGSSSDENILQRQSWIEAMRNGGAIGTIFSSEEITRLIKQ